MQMWHTTESLVDEGHVSEVPLVHEGHVSDPLMDEGHVSDPLVDESVHLGDKRCMLDSLVDGSGTLVNGPHYLNLPLDVSQWNNGLGPRQSETVPPLLND